MQTSKDQVISDLTGQDQKQNDARIKSLNETLGLLGVAKDTKGNIKIDTQKTALSAKDAVYEIRDKLAQIREPAQEEISVWNDIISDDKKFLAHVEANTPDSDEEFSQLKNIIAYNLS